MFSLQFKTILFLLLTISLEVYGWGKPMPHSHLKRYRVRRGIIMPRTSPGASTSCNAVQCPDNAGSDGDGTYIFTSQSCTDGSHSSDTTSCLYTNNGSSATTTCYYNNGGTNSDTVQGTSPSAGSGTCTDGEIENYCSGDGAQVSTACINA